VEKLSKINQLAYLSSSLQSVLTTIKKLIVRGVIYYIYDNSTKRADTLTTPPPVIARAGQLLEFQRRVTKESITGEFSNRKSAKTANAASKGESFPFNTLKRALIPPSL